MGKTNCSDAVNAALTGEAQRNALDFVAFMIANEMPPDPTDDHWFKHQGENICCIILGVCEAHNMSGSGDNWSVYWANCDVHWGENDTADNALEQFVFRSENPCGQCPCAHSPGVRKTVFGKVYENACYSTLCFDNPSTANLAYIKKLATMRKQDIAAKKGK